MFWEQQFMGHCSYYAVQSQLPLVQYEGRVGDGEGGREGEPTSLPVVVNSAEKIRSTTLGLGWNLIKLHQEVAFTSFSRLWFRTKFYSAMKERRNFMILFGSQTRLCGMTMTIDYDILLGLFSCQFSWWHYYSHHCHVDHDRLFTSSSVMIY